MLDEMMYPRIRSYVLETPWAILPGTLATILDALTFRAQGGRLTAEEIRERIGAVSRPTASQSGSIAVLPLFGVVCHRIGSMDDASGGTSVERFAGQFRAAMAEPSIGAIIIDIDSPGGAVSGVDELAAEIYQARGRKPIVAVANSMAASAAYWIGSAAGELSVIPTGEVGSIGVLAAHQSVAGQQERQGVKTTLVTAGRHKAEGNPFEPLTDEARAEIQARVDDYYAMFVRAVARNRGVPAETVRTGYGEGRVVGARKALDLGMVDYVETMDQTIVRVAKMLRSGHVNGARALAAAEQDISLPPFKSYRVTGVPDSVLDADGTIEPETTALTGGETVTVSFPVAGPLPPHKSPAIAPDDAEWDGPAEVAKANGAMELRRMHAWVDSAGDPEAKSSYKLPHHRADGTLVPAACTAVMGAMHGGRGGVDIPDGDRAGVDRHMQGHYEELGRSMPTMEGALPGPGVDTRRRRLRLATGRA